MLQSLALQVQEALKRDPHAGDLYVFRGRRGDRVSWCILLQKPGSWSYFLFSNGPSWSACDDILHAYPDGLVPIQGASAHARVSDHAGPSGRSHSRTRPHRLPRSETRRRPGDNFFRGSMAGLCPPLRRFARTLTNAGARLGADVGRYSFHRVGLAPTHPAASPSTAIP